MADHYAVLGVGKNADEGEIKKAYRKLARQYHPDQNPDDPAAEAKFKEVANAYEVLGDPDRRARYDRFGDDGLGGQGQGPGTGPFGANLGDIFDTFFGGGSPFGGGGGRPSGPPRGEDLETVLDLDLSDAVFGGEKLVEIRTAVSCAPCDSTGSEPGSGTSTCGECGGAGQVQRVRQSILGQLVTAAQCPTCSGRGQLIDDPCQSCDGEGRTIEEVTYTVDVPPGVDSGSTLRLTGRGAAGPRGGPQGDLYVHINVREHELFTRAGDDLILEQPIGFAQAALGAELHIPTLEEDEVIIVPPGTQTGRRFRLRAAGVPHVNGRGRGDLIVQLVVQTPTDLSEEQHGLLRQFAELRAEAVAPPEEGFFGKVKSAFK